MKRQTHTTLKTLWSLLIRWRRQPKRGAVFLGLTRSHLRCTRVSPSPSPGGCQPCPGRLWKPKGRLQVFQVSQAPSHWTAFSSWPVSVLLGEGSGEKCCGYFYGTKCDSTKAFGVYLPCSGDGQFFFPWPRYHVEFFKLCVFISLNGKEVLFVTHRKQFKSIVNASLCASQQKLIQSSNGLSTVFIPTYKYDTTKTSVDLQLSWCFPNITALLLIQCIVSCWVLFCIPGRTNQNITTRATATSPAGRETPTTEKWEAVPEAEEHWCGQDHHKPKPTSTVAFFIAWGGPNFKVCLKNLNGHSLFTGLEWQNYLCPFAESNSLHYTIMLHGKNNF